MKRILLSLLMTCLAVFPFSFLNGLQLFAQATPTCMPTASFSYVKDGALVENEAAESYSGSGPVTGRFAANTTGADGYEVRYEWRIYASDKSWNDYIVTRTDEAIEYTFEQSGSFYVELRVSFTKTGVTETFPAEGAGASRFQVSVAESKLEMPNAFSPNDDGYNDVYRAKPTHQSIVEFKATIFNRWGQRLYSWDNVNGGWDGKVNGHVVNPGVYYVNVVAKGADGVVYKIRKDVNVLTGYTKHGETNN